MSINPNRHVKPRQGVRQGEESLSEFYMNMDSFHKKFSKFRDEMGWNMVRIKDKRLPKRAETNRQKDSESEEDHW